MVYSTTKRHETLRSVYLNKNVSYLFYREDINQSMGIFKNAKTEPVENTKIMFSFISFPSAKDPEYETKFPGWLDL